MGGEGGRLNLRWPGGERFARTKGSRDAREETKNLGLQRYITERLRRLAKALPRRGEKIKKGKGSLPKRQLAQQSTAYGES